MARWPNEHGDRDQWAPVLKDYIDESDQQNAIDISGKADQTDLESLSSVVDDKADSSQVDVSLNPDGTLKGDQVEAGLVDAGLAVVTDGEWTSEKAKIAGMPEFISGNYTKRVENYPSFAAAVYDLPDHGAKGGRLLIDGHLPVSSSFSVPSGLELVGRGSGSSALIAPAGVNFPVLTLDSVANAVVSGLSILKAPGAKATGNGDGVRVLGASRDVLIKDVVAKEFVNPFYVDGHLGTNPGFAERISFHGTRAHRSPSGFGYRLDWVDVVTFLDAHALENWLDGFKAHGKTLNISITNGSSRRNGQIFVVTGLDGGDGFDGYAGGSTFLTMGFITDENNGHGMQVKSGPLNRDDLANYGQVDNLQIIAHRAVGNTNYGATVHVNDGADLTQATPGPAILMAGYFAENTLGGIHWQARNGEIHGPVARRNGQNGLTLGTRAIDTTVFGGQYIGNGYPTPNTGTGIYDGGENTVIYYPTIIGRDTDQLRTEADYSGDIYTNLAVRIASTAKGTHVLHYHDKSFRHSTTNAHQVDVTSGATVIVHYAGTGNPGRAGSGGSTYTRVDAASPEDKFWVKADVGAPSSTAGWVRRVQTTTRTSLPTASASYVGMTIYLKPNSSTAGTYHVCRETSSAGTYEWLQVTAT